MIYMAVENVEATGLESFLAGILNQAQEVQYFKKHIKHCGCTTHDDDFQRPNIPDSRKLENHLIMSIGFVLRRCLYHVFHYRAQAHPSVPSEALRASRSRPKEKLPNSRGVESESKLPAGPLSFFGTHTHSFR